MTRFIHHQFAKQYLTELLTPYGQVETSKDITAEVRQIDVLFIPSPQPTQSLETLGILGRMAANYAIFEPFPNPVSKSEIRSCIGKLFDVHADLERQFKDIDKDDQELIMKLSEMYQQQLEEIKKQERQEGVEREGRAMIESILQVRFGAVDSQLATIINPLIAMNREEFTPLLLQLSREELLARFA